MDGIIDLMTRSQEAEYEAFLHDYERVRESEGWGGDDLDLPFGALRHHYVWNVRKRTFRKFSEIVSREFPHSGAALDAAAGNGWLTRHLCSWGFTVIAQDVSIGERDGLRAAGHYLAQGFDFERVRAPIEALPFVDHSFDLIVVAGSFHYMDGIRVLNGFRRVLRPQGRVVVFDSPWYERGADGDRAVDQRIREHRRRYGVEASVGSQSSYLLREGFEQTVRKAGFVAQIFPVWPGLRRTWESMRARLKAERIATFPVIVLKEADESLT